VVDPIGIPETVCSAIEHDPQTAVTPDDVSQRGVSGLFVARAHDEEPPGDGLARARASGILLVGAP
jgi:hypothetical protein